MPPDNFKEAFSNIATHVGRGVNKAHDSTFTVYVVDVIDDPKRVSDERKETILKFLHNKKAFDYLPGKSIIFAKINKNGKMKGNKVFYALPFMSPHFSQPINAGELAWVFNDNGAYFWITRKASLTNLEDVNYTSGLREIDESDESSERSNVDIAMGIESTDETATPDFPSITQSENEDLLKLLTFSDSHSSKSFVAEPTPNVKPTGNEFVIQGGNNSSIKLGNNNFYNTGNIELTAGITSNINSIDRTNDRGFIEASRVVIEDQNPAEGISEPFSDSSSIYISMNSNGDEDLGLGFTYSDQVSGTPFIIAKSSEIRLAARGGVRAKSGAGAELDLMSNGEAALVGSRVFLGSPSSEHTGDLTNEHQHVIRGDDLVTAINNFADAIDTALGTAGGTMPIGVTAGNLGAPLTTFQMIHDACEDFKTESLAALSAIVHTE